MGKTVKFLLALLLLTATALGQPKAVINGPTVAPAGEGVLITAEGSVGDNLVWIMPENLAVFTCNTDQLFFSTTRQGRYEFILIAVDKEAEVAYARHTVTVGKPPPEEEPGDPTPALDFAKISKEFAPTDASTAVTMKKVILQVHTNIAALCNTGQCPSLADATKLYQRAVGDTLLTRPRGTQSNWVPWRQTLNDAIISVNPSTTEQLQAIWLAVTQGL